MDVNFKYEKAGANDPIIFEQIWGEKPGGGLVASPTFTIPVGTAVGLSSGKFVPIKAFKLVTKVESADTAIEIAKGSGIVSGDIIGYGETAVASTAVDTDTDADKDTITVSLGVAVPVGTILYEAKAASAAASGGDPAVLGEPKLQPLYVTGEVVEAGAGDKLIKLVNGANLRKETANIAPEVAKLLKTINLV